MVTTKGIQAKGRSTTKTSTRTSRKPKRIPLSGSRKRMHIEEEFKDPNYHYAWINDQKDLIFRAKRGGYENVTISEIPSWGVADVDTGSSTSEVISMKVNADTFAFLMKLPMEYYLEDRAAMDALVDAREADMKKGLNSGDGGTYGSIKIE